VTTGYAREEVLGRTPAILKSGEHQAGFYRGFWAKILSGEVFRGTIVNKKKSGELYHAEQTVTPVRSDSDEITHLVSVAKDMTERRKAQELETELRLASEVQRRLFPQVWPRIHGLDIESVALPAATVCGDYLDYVAMSGGALGIVIGDASGHGMGPALVMAQMRAYVRSLVGTGQQPGEILRGLNQTLVADLEDNHYATLFLATLEPAGSCLSYASAGHTPGFLLDANGEVNAVLESTGVPLGMFPDREYATRRGLRLDPGDLLVLTTAGVTEASRGDGSQFGREALVEVVRRHRHADSAREILQGLREQVRKFVDGGPQLDDMTMLVARRDRTQDPLQTRLAHAPPQKPQSPLRP
jgi:sigma-B regulation protein RsbU (phosphoserine phosphatase)